MLGQSPQVEPAINPVGQQGANDTQPDKEETAARPIEAPMRDEDNTNNGTQPLAQAGVMADTAHTAVLAPLQPVIQVALPLPYYDVLLERINLENSRKHGNNAEKVSKLIRGLPLGHRKWLAALGVMQENQSELVRQTAQKDKPTVREFFSDEKLSHVRDDCDEGRVYELLEIQYLKGEGDATSVKVSDSYLFQIFVHISAAKARVNPGVFSTQKLLTQYFTSFKDRLRDIYNDGRMRGAFFKNMDACGKNFLKIRYPARKTERPNVRAVIRLLSRLHDLRMAKANHIIKLRTCSLNMILEGKNGVGKGLKDQIIPVALELNHFLEASSKACNSVEMPNLVDAYVSFAQTKEQSPQVGSNPPPSHWIGDRRRDQERYIHVTSIKGHNRLISTAPLRSGDFLGYVFGTVQSYRSTKDISSTTHFGGTDEFALRPSPDCILAKLLQSCFDEFTPNRNVVVTVEAVSANPILSAPYKWPAFATDNLPAFTELVGIDMTRPSD